MRISFVQSGGFLGLIKGCEFDTKKLNPDTAKELERIAGASGILTSGQFFSKTARDLQQYRITIKDEDLEVSATFDDETLPTNARALVGYLQKHARPKAA